MIASCWWSDPRTTLRVSYLSIHFFTVIIVHQPFSSKRAQDLCAISIADEASVFCYANSIFLSFTNEYWQICPDIDLPNEQRRLNPFLHHFCAYMWFPYHSSVVNISICCETYLPIKGRIAMTGDFLFCRYLSPHFSPVL